MKTERDKRRDTERELEKRKSCSFTCPERLSDLPQTQHQSQKEGEKKRRDFPLSAKKKEYGQVVATECGKCTLHQHYHSPSHPFLWH